MILLCSCSASDEAASADTSAQSASDTIEYDFTVLESNLADTGLYGNGLVLSTEDISSQLLLDTSLLDEYFVYRHDDPLKASIIIVLKPTAGNEDSIKTSMTSFLDMYKDTFDLYAPEEYALVEDYYTIDKGDYIIYTVSEDNSAVINAINRSKNKLWYLVH